MALHLPAGPYGAVLQAGSVVPADHILVEASDTQVCDSLAVPTCAPALAELATLIVEVLGHADVLHQGPGAPTAQQACWEDHGVEGHVVLAHELHQLHILRGLPPAGPATRHSTSQPSTKVDQTRNAYFISTFPGMAEVYAGATTLNNQAAEAAFLAVIRLGSGSQNTRRSQDTLASQDTQQHPNPALVSFSHHCFHSGV